MKNPSTKLHIPLKISFCRGAKKHRYKVNSQQNTQLITRHVHVVTLKRFAVLLFLPSCCVNSLLTKCYKILYMLMIIISEYRSSLDLLCVWCKFNVALLFKLIQPLKLSKLFVPPLSMNHYHFFLASYLLFSSAHLHSVDEPSYLCAGDICVYTSILISFHL